VTTGWPGSVDAMKYPYYGKTGVIPDRRNHELSGMACGKVQLS